MNILIFLLFSLILLCGRYCLVNSIRVMPKNIAYWYFFILLLIISGFRYNVGYDYPVYYNHIVESSTWAIENFEFIPRCFLIASKRLNMPWLFFFLFSFTTLGLFFTAIKKFSVDTYVSLVIFFTLFFLTSLSSVRQWLAIALVFYSYKYIQERSFIKFLFCVVLAGNCHTTAYIAILLYPMFWWIPSNIIIFSSLALFFLHDKLLTLILNILNLGKYQIYLENMAFSNRGGGKVAFVYYVLIFINLFFYFYFKLYKKNSDEKRLIAITTFGITFHSMLGTSTGLRLAYYFYIFFIVLEPVVFKRVKEKKFQYIILFCFYLFYLLFLYVDSMNDQGYTRYLFYFLK